MPADWQLPPGVSRGLWEYAHDADIARRYDAALAETKLLSWDVAFVREYVPDPLRFIDLGCGTGRLSIGLAREGFAVTAVDLSEEMLTIVGEKAAHAGVAVDRLKVNLVDLRGIADQSFDGAACLFQTLGMIAGSGARQQVVRHVHRILRPGGRFVLHVHNRWFNAWTRHGRRLLARELFHSWRGQQEPGDYLMPPHQGIAAMPMHMFTRREIGSLLRDAGFRIDEIRPVALSNDGRLSKPWLFGALRSYGYLIAAQRPLE